MYPSSTGMRNGKVLGGEYSNVGRTQEFYAISLKTGGKAPDDIAMNVENFWELLNRWSNGHGCVSYTIYWSINSSVFIPHLFSLRLDLYQALQVQYRHENNYGQMNFCLNSLFLIFGTDSVWQRQCQLRCNHLPFPSYILGSWRIQVPWITEGGSDVSRFRTRITSYMKAPALLNAEIEMAKICSCNLASSCYNHAAYLLLYFQEKKSQLGGSSNGSGLHRALLRPLWLQEPYFKLHIKMLTTCYLLVSPCGLFGLRPSDITACQWHFVMPIYSALPFSPGLGKMKSNELKQVSICIQQTGFYSKNSLHCQDITCQVWWIVWFLVSSHMQIHDKAVSL